MMSLWPPVFDITHGRRLFGFLGDLLIAFTGIDVVKAVFMSLFKNRLDFFDDVRMLFGEVLLAGNIALEPCGPFPPDSYLSTEFEAMFYGLTFAAWKSAAASPVVANRLALREGTLRTIGVSVSCTLSSAST